MFKIWDKNKTAIITASITLTSFCFCYSTFAEHAKNICPPISLPHLAGLEKVSCYQNHCITLGSVGKLSTLLQAIPLTYESKDYGKTWSKSHGFPNINHQLKLFKSRLLESLSCTNHTCVAVGSFKSDSVLQPLIYTKKQASKIWSCPIAPTLPQNANGGKLSSVSCQDNICVTVGEFYDDSGATFPLSYYSVDGGYSWSLPITPPSLTNKNSGILNSVTCKNKVCLAVGNDIDNIDSKQNTTPTKPVAFKSFDGGMTWSEAIFLPIIDPMNSTELSLVTCDASICTVVANVIHREEIANGHITTTYPIVYSSQDGGATWSLPFILNVPEDYSSSDYPENITCNGKNCMIIAHLSYQDGYDTISEPIIYSSKDRGVSWNGPLKLNFTSNNFDSKHLDLYDLTCEGQNCVAVGNSDPAMFLSYPIVITSSDGGVTWSGLQLKS